VPEAAPPETPAEIPMETAASDVRRMIDTAKAEKQRPCIVCGKPCSQNSTEGLCWVCRRLKLSAWRDTDTQMPAQE
jgi:hypothetical protein